ncbi:MAG: hypothetical protein AAF772_07130 [Acidobacteriota bacterium]
MHRIRFAPTSSIVPLFVLLLAALSVAALRADDDGASGVVRLQLDALTGDHVNVMREDVELLRGAVTVRLRSPSHRVTVHAHEISLRPLGAPGDGRLFASLSATFEGAGDLIAEVVTGPSSAPAQRWDDRVVAPKQDVRVAGTIELIGYRDGFVVHLIELPATLSIEVESALLEQLLGTCRALEAVPMVPIDCGALAPRLRRPPLPLPPAGTRLWLSNAQLTDAERTALTALARPVEADVPPAAPAPSTASPSSSSPSSSRPSAVPAQEPPAS